MICPAQRDSQQAARRPRCSAFTLLELLVVIGLIAALSVFLLGNLASGGKSGALQSAQATVANMLVATRMKAMASGQSVRFLVNVDQNSTAQPSRFLRYIAIQIQMSGGWQPAAEAYLPDGAYLIPGNFASIPAGLFAANTATAWVKSDGSNLRSTALQNGNISAETINSPTAEQWVYLTISAPGTTANSGDIILAFGKRRPPGTYAAGESPVELENPEEVRGLTLSSYGVTALINSRASF